MTDPAERSSLDDVIDVYKAGIDRTLLRENLRRTPAERLANLAALQRFAESVRGAARGASATGTRVPARA